MKREHFVKVVEEALDSLPKLLESGPFVGEVLPEVSHGRVARAITSISTFEGAPLKLRLGGGFLPVDAPAQSEDYPFPLPTRAVRRNSNPTELTLFFHH